MSNFDSDKVWMDRAEDALFEALLGAVKERDEMGAYQWARVLKELGIV